MVEEITQREKYEIMHDVTCVLIADLETDPNSPTLITELDLEMSIEKNYPHTSSIVAKLYKNHFQDEYEIDLEILKSMARVYGVLKDLEDQV